MGSAVPWYRRGRTSVIIDPLLSWRESVGRKGAEEVENAKAKELYKTSVDGLLIKIAKSKGLRVDAGVLDYEMK
ncbi:hypothetical protein BHE74_00029603 [Ensete ventricosum]|nr:hypothetical protein BHE74_00029603 [Ensete ventricosum]RZR91977.1 hypothetical protein BHM03_00020191 [Ensete ventricosum]